MKECVHLRKMLNGSHSDTVLESEKVRIEMMNQINRMKADNAKLLVKISKDNQGGQDEHKNNSRLDELEMQLKKIYLENEKISEKL